MQLQRRGAGAHLEHGFCGVYARNRSIVVADDVEKTKFEGVVEHLVRVRVRVRVTDRSRVRVTDRSRVRIRVRVRVTVTVTIRVKPNPNPNQAGAPGRRRYGCWRTAS